MVEETLRYLTEQDEEIGLAVAEELSRQRNGIELIASENVVSPAVLAAAGTILTKIGRAHV